MTLALDKPMVAVAEVYGVQVRVHDDRWAWVTRNGNATSHPQLANRHSTEAAAMDTARRLSVKTNYTYRVARLA